MILQKPKKLLWILAVLLILTVLSVALFFFYMGRGAYSGAFYYKAYDLSVLQEENVLLGVDRAKTLSSGEQRISLKNNGSVDLSLSLFAKGESLFDCDLSSGEEREIVLTLKEEGTLSLAAWGNSVSFAWITEETSAAPCAEALPDGGDLFFSTPVILEEMTLLKPYRLFGDVSFTKLQFETQNQGKIVLSPEREISGELAVYASACEVYVQRFTATYPDEARDYHLKAKFFNRGKLDPNAFPVSTYDELARLADPNQFPNLSENGTIRFLRYFDLKGDVDFSLHANLEFPVPLGFSSHSIRFVTKTEGTFGVKTALGVGISAANLVFDAPLSDLIWESEGALPARTTVEKISNLSSYNREKLSLGGKGSALPILTLFAEENESLTQDVTFFVSGNTLKGKLPYLVSAAQLNEMAFSLSCEGGKARLEGDLYGGRVIASDENGNERAFSVEVEREGMNLPVLYLETENGAEITSKSQYVPATFSMDGSKTQYTTVPETSIRIRGRGNSTWKWDKKPYKIHFQEPTSILGLPAAEEWALFANYADKSLMRNKLAQVMAEQLSFEYCPTQVYVDLFLNGEYMGVYGLGEHLEEGEGRVEVTHDMTRQDCGFFMEAGGVVSGVDVMGMNWFHADLLRFVLIKGPEYNTLTSEQFDYIRSYLTDLSQKIRDGEGYEEYLDMETFVDWLIMIELSNNVDCAYRRSTNLVKNPDEKLKFGPVWDFDLAFGNFSKDDGSYSSWVSTSEDDYVGETWSTYLLEDPKFRSLFKARWEEVKGPLLEAAMECINTDYELLKPSAELNFERWDILGKKVAFEPQNTKFYTTYESQIHYLKNFLNKRAAWITSQVKDW